MSKSPEWYDESKLTKILYESRERGWAVNMGDGLYRLANSPIRSAFEETSARWGDLVRLKPNNGEDQWLEIVERYVPSPEELSEDEDAD